MDLTQEVFQMNSTHKGGYSGLHLKDTRCPLQLQQRTCLDLRNMTFIPFGGQTRTRVPFLPRSWQHSFEAMVDSGSTQTITTGEALSLFREPLQPHDQMVATAATGGQLQITERGHVTPTYEVYYAPQLRRSVVSVYELCEQGHKWP